MLNIQAETPYQQHSRERVPESRNALGRRVLTQQPVQAMSENHDNGSSTTSMAGFSEAGVVPQTAMPDLNHNGASAADSADSVYQSKQARPVLRVSRGGASESRKQRLRAGRNTVLMAAKST